MCALAIQGAAAPVGAAEYELRLSAFCFRFFFRSFRHLCRSGALPMLPPALPAAAFARSAEMKLAVTVSNAAVNELGR
jgi:hypothetical protein